MAIKGKLNPKQKAFCHYYLFDNKTKFNATQSAIKAGYSKKTAYAVGHKLLKKVEIQEEFARISRKTAEKCEINAEFVLKRLLSTAMCDPRKFLKWGNKGLTIKNSDELSEYDASLIQEIVINKHGVKLKTPNKNEAIKMLGQYLALFVDRHEISGHLTFSEFIKGLIAPNDE